MIRFEIHENGAVLRAFRNAWKSDDRVPNTYLFIQDQAKHFGRVNNCRVIGSPDAGGWWCTDAIEFDTDEALSMFLLRWS